MPLWVSLATTHLAAPPPAMDSSSSSKDTTVLPHGLSTSTQASSSSLASAIANFKPSSREVISGIAPHVFDERRKRRKKSLRSIRKRYSADQGTHSTSSSSSSPLRCSAVIAWDNGSMILLGTCCGKDLRAYHDVRATSSCLSFQ